MQEVPSALLFFCPLFLPAMSPPRSAELLPGLPSPPASRLWPPPAAINQIYGFWLNGPVLTYTEPMPVIQPLPSLLADRTGVCPIFGMDCGRSTPLALMTWDVQEEREKPGKRRIRQIIAARCDGQFKGIMRTSKRDWSGKRDSNSRPQPWQARIMLYQLDVVMSVLRYWINELQGEILERETRLELATPTLARSCSTN